MQRIPASIEWAGLRNEAFGTVRACFREFSSNLETIASGYKMFSKKGRPFVVPTTSFEPHIMLPRDYIKWLVDQPEDILSHGQVHGEKLGLRYLFPGFDYTTDIALITAIRLHLTRNLGNIEGDLIKEIRSVTDATFGVDDQTWTEVNLFTAMNTIVFNSSGFLLFGEPLCRNERFMRSMRRFGDIFGAGMLCVGQLTPRLFRRVVGCLFVIPTAYYQAICARYLWPVFADRLEKMKRNRVDPAFNYNAPNDLITWMFRAALDMKDSTIESPRPLVKRFTLVTSGAISSSSVTATNMLIDVLSSDLNLHYYRTLRSEAESVFPTTDHWARPASLLQLRHMDSTIRESLRRSPILVRGLWREVMPKDGVTLPNGQRLPQGAWLGVPVPGIHNDERYYHEPEVYAPFRFVPSSLQDRNVAKGDDTNAENCKPAILTMTSDTFLPFGYARHSCPGRWFASHHLKLVLAYIVVHYDIQPLQERPLNHIWGEHPVPSPNTLIKVRRRKVT
ncbi:uncharacterized protein N7446_004475 [Penicillium canescens]|uniref:Cytochrome P450 n=1 Tax=Penicillium canescens TaxID=5083 RepID=A0AAD6N3C7_PENCN|nr:uncharacterized protein N7446_004475 [Penicillium canescens]KAJ6026922.1 hypothetical protein N7460_011739 [Penicillium canescens]KAJ6040206.1 hypothetical protein N7444_009111 [Penicillium canescens]KAJ6067438.1 hypothetical protein N7446_004475 [Penicillium canescens]